VLLVLVKSTSQSPCDHRVFQHNSTNDEGTYISNEVISVGNCSSVTVTGLRLQQVSVLFNITAMCESAASTHPAVVVQISDSQLENFSSIAITGTNSLSQGCTVQVELTRLRVTNALLLLAELRLVSWLNSTVLPAAEIVPFDAYIHIVESEFSAWGPDNARACQDYTLVGLIVRTLPVANLAAPFQFAKTFSAFAQLYTISFSGVGASLRHHRCQFSCYGGPALGQGYGGYLCAAATFGRGYHGFENLASFVDSDSVVVVSVNAEAEARGLYVYRHSLYAANQGVICLRRANITVQYTFGGSLSGPYATAVGLDFNFFWNVLLARSGSTIALDGCVIRVDGGKWMRAVGVLIYDLYRGSWQVDYGSSFLIDGTRINAASSVWAAAMEVFVPMQVAVASAVVVQHSKLSAVSSSGYNWAIRLNAGITVLNSSSFAVMNSTLEATVPLAGEAISMEIALNGQDLLVSEDSVFALVNSSLIAASPGSPTGSAPTVWRYSGGNGATIRVSNGSSFAMIGVNISLTVKTAYFRPAAIRILGGPQLYDDGVPADQSRSTFLFDSLHTRISAGPDGVSSTLVTFNAPPARLSAARLTANYSATLWARCLHRNGSLLTEVTSEATGGILQGTAALSDDILAASVDDTATCGLITSQVGQRALDNSRASLATSVEMCELPSAGPLHCGWGSARGVPAWDEQQGRCGCRCSARDAVVLDQLRRYRFESVRINGECVVVPSGVLLSWHVRRAAWSRDGLRAARTDTSSRSLTSSRQPLSTATISLTLAARHHTATLTAPRSTNTTVPTTAPRTPAPSTAGPTTPPLAPPSTSHTSGTSATTTAALPSSDTTAKGTLPDDADAAVEESVADLMWLPASVVRPAVVVASAVASVVSIQGASKPSTLRRVAMAADACSARSAYSVDSLNDYPDAMTVLPYVALGDGAVGRATGAAAFTGGIGAVTLLLIVTAAPWLAGCSAWMRMLVSSWVAFLAAYLAPTIGEAAMFVVLKGASHQVAIGVAGALMAEAALLLLAHTAWRFVAQPPYLPTDGDRLSHLGRVLWPAVEGARDPTVPSHRMYPIGDLCAATIIGIASGALRAGEDAPTRPCVWAPPAILVASVTLTAYLLIARPLADTIEWVLMLAVAGAQSLLGGLVVAATRGVGSLDSSIAILASVIEVLTLALPVVLAVWALWEQRRCSSGSKADRDSERSVPPLSSFDDAPLLIAPAHGDSVDHQIHVVQNPLLK
jgi:hypothetical protein